MRAQQGLALMADAKRPASREEIVRCRDAIESRFREGHTLAYRVTVGFGAAGQLRVDGPASAVEVEMRADNGSDVRLELAPADLLRVHQRQLDIRQTLLFGQLKIIAGTPRVAFEFGDFLAGVPRISPAVPDAEALPKPVTDLDRARDDLQVHGYCIVADALSADDLARLRRRVVNQARAEAEQGMASMGAGSSDQRIWNLINKGQEFVDLLENPLIDAIVTPFLGENFLLTSYSANMAGPGNSPGGMHYDQIYVHPPIPQVAIGLNVAWFLDDVSAANGGTRLIPGSHRTGAKPEDLFSTEGAVAATGPAGSALFFDSRVWHATGQNVTEVPRHVVLTYFNRSFMRTQENYFLSLLPAVQRNLSPRIKTMLGFKCTGSLGGVEGPIEGLMVERPSNPIGEMEPKTQ